MKRHTLLIVLAQLFISLLHPLYSWPIDSVLSRGDSSVSIAWTPDSINTNPAWYVKYGTQCTGSDTIYLHSDFLPDRTYRGVAYSYGGEDPWDLFRDRVEQGFLVGSHSCHYNEYGDPSDTIAGTDCSGFLCYIWNAPRMSTRGLLSSPLFNKIDKKDLRTGDGLVKASSSHGFHAVFVVEADVPSEMVIWEASSTVFGCRERITDLSDPYWEPYTALRYPDLISIRNNTEIDRTINSLATTKRGAKGAITLKTLLPYDVLARVYTLQGQLLREQHIPKGVTNSILYTNNHGIGAMYIVTLYHNEQILISKPIILCD